MKQVFRDYNTHGMVTALQRYTTQQIATPQTQDANAPGPSHTTTSQLQGLSGQDIYNALAVSKEENMTRILHQVVKNMDRK
jgi:hypothetical protein